MQAMIRAGLVLAIAAMTVAHAGPAREPGTWDNDDFGRLGARSPATQARLARLAAPLSAPPLSGPNVPGTQDAKLAPHRGDVLVAAAARGDRARVAEQIAQGVGPNSTDASGRPPLMAAVAAGHTETVRVLLEAGADPSIKFGGLTALGIAIRERRDSLVNVLLKAGAQPDQREDAGGTPLHAAAALGRLASVEELVAAGANLNASDRQGRTALIVAVLNGHRNVVQQLLSAGADANRPGRDGFSPLYWAVYRRDRVAAEALIAAGARTGTLSIETLD